jgi:tetratricopeptide (TPR) repeat protein
MNQIYTFFLLAVLVSGCTEDLRESIDFVAVDNPNIYQESIIGVKNSSLNWMIGLEKEMSNTLNEIVLIAELGSDNYTNTETFYNPFMDQLSIRTNDPDIQKIQFQIARLREMAIFGLDEVGPNDENYNPGIAAEFHFFEGMSYLFAGMYFSYLPADVLGVPLSSEAHFNKAIESMTNAITNNPTPAYYLARARAYYYLGDRINSVADATSALAADPKFLRAAEFDDVNGPSNRMENAIFRRFTNDLQPLPSLDFLDPKYAFDGNGTPPSIYYLKAEEAHLILAEANLTTGNLGGAKANFEALRALILDVTRVVKTLNDSREDRKLVRPINEEVTVNGNTGLILSRQRGFVSVPNISGMSLSTNQINDLDLSDDSLKLLYKTRQEVFIAEGLRFVDMGIKLVINENEILQNDNIEFGTPGTLPVIPIFITTVTTTLDSFNYDFFSSPTICTITTDVNEVLVQNKSSNQVLPFY